jgi:hypothetical protein
MAVKNALISDVRIMLDNRAVLTAYLWLDYDGSGEGFGYFGLSNIKKDFHDLNYAGYFIHRVLETVGVTEWEKLKGNAIRVDTELDCVKAIGHIIKDEWFNSKEEFKNFVTELSAPSGNNSARQCREGE